MKGVSEVPLNCWAIHLETIKEFRETCCLSFILSPIFYLLEALFAHFAQYQAPQCEAVAEKNPKNTLSVLILALGNGALSQEAWKNILSQIFEYSFKELTCEMTTHLFNALSSRSSDDRKQVEKKLFSWTDYNQVDNLHLYYLICLYFLFYETLPDQFLDFLENKSYEEIFKAKNSLSSFNYKDQPYQASLIFEAILLKTEIIDDSSNFISLFQRTYDFSKRIELHPLFKDSLTWESYILYLANKIVSMENSCELHKIVDQEMWEKIKKNIPRKYRSIPNNNENKPLDPDWIHV
ncbi:MAG: hypothetical protein WDZ28_02920 [Simkaniaceae bacterium]